MYALTCSYRPGLRQRAIMAALDEGRANGWSDRCSSGQTGRMDSGQRHEFPDIDLETASLARVYDAHLGGEHNYAVDRRMVDELERAMPGLAREGSIANRAFLGRAVRFCADAGIDQFLDVGSGIPTVGNVHEVAQAANPDAHTVYVDIDGVAVTMGRQILADDPRSEVVRGDFRDPASILDARETRDLIDFDRPLAILIVAMLHAIPDSSSPTELVRQLTGPAVVGSMLVVSHFGRGVRPDTETAAAQRVLGRSSTPVTPRDKDQLRNIMGDFEPVEPGVVSVNRWRPDPDQSTGRDSPNIGAVGVLRRARADVAGRDAG